MKPTERFSDRVSDYAKYRPSYPSEILPYLSQQTDLASTQIVADVGSGTGILTRLLLDFGLTVFAIEPNLPMRNEAELELSAYPKFRSIDGTAENTHLDQNSVDHIFAAQAFHWFQPEPTRREWLRILKPAGFAYLLWNSPIVDQTPFQIGYEDIKKHFGTDFNQIFKTYNSSDETKRMFFGGKSPEKKLFSNFQLFDFEGLKGRLFSSSYMPAKDHPNYKPAVNALDALFQKYQENGQIRMDYVTEVYYGRLGVE